MSELKRLRPGTEPELPDMPELRRWEHLAACLADACTRQSRSRVSQGVSCEKPKCEIEAGCGGWDPALNGLNSCKIVISEAPKRCIPLVFVVPDAALTAIGQVDLVISELFTNSIKGQDFGRLQSVDSGGDDLTKE